MKKSKKNVSEEGYTSPTKITFYYYNYCNNNNLIIFFFIIYFY